MAKGGARSHQLRTVEVQTEQPLLNQRVRQYFEQHAPSRDTAAWLRTPEVPTSKEVAQAAPIDQRTGRTEMLVSNLVKGAWESKEAYLRAHYSFLREEAVRPLREAVQQMKVMPTACESSFSEAKNTIGIYERVRIVGLVTSTRGVAIRITFSTKRAGMGILWKQTNRLLSGKLVALTPNDDMFRTKTVVATIAARSLEGLEQNPPELELFFGNADELELDPAVEWTMIEARSSFFEAQRHTMLALQKLMHEPLPMLEHLLAVNNDIGAPIYLPQKPTIDLGPISSQEDGLSEVDIFATWPDTSTILDQSQLIALQRIVTKSLAIVQGPPGTGKTFVSVKALQVILANRQSDDPPIIVTAQTNHALDQLLRHIAKFEPNFARLGGRTKDRKIVRERTMYELRYANKSADTLRGCQAPAARKAMRGMEKEIEELIAPLKAGNLALDAEFLRKIHLLSDTQVKSLEQGANQWVQASLSNPAETRSPFNVWLSRALVKVPYKPELENFGFEFEEAEIEYEQLLEIEAENGVKEEEYIDALAGNSYTLADNYTCPTKNKIDDKAVERLLKKEKNLWDIPEALRPSVYNYLQTRCKLIITEAMRQKVHVYDNAARRARIGNFERDELILREQKVIGMTTTGLSKYRGLIASLGCKIVLVEEAAETLEAPVIAACLPSLEHLILVGDHQQLRPQCTVKAHERKRLSYNISMFERLVNNDMGKTTLIMQRRMIPEVRRILRPIYQDVIRDHDSVRDPVNRPDVPGMGGINSYFFTHSWREQRDEMSSYVNIEEADMIVGLVEHLLYNGMRCEEITILTFYNGQRKQISRALRKSSALKDLRFQVVTVDSYQGEENKVVILSLVRSNKDGVMGFLSAANRICVALSRAQCGFYLFGDGQTLSTNPIWKQVILLMLGLDTDHAEEIPTIEIQRFGDTLPVHCVQHDRIVVVARPSDWNDLSGGCAKPCAKVLECGHSCVLPCHPFSHDRVACTQVCNKILPCQHNCVRECWELCVCQQCKVNKQPPELDRGAMVNTPRNSSADSSASASWQAYAKEASALYAEAKAIMPRAGGPSGAAGGGVSSDPASGREPGSHQKSSPLKKEIDLIDLDDNEECQHTASTSPWQPVQYGMDHLSLL
ncbi:hypothetical protein AMS68_000729 [Peltaster fructicola]|uniref:Helicase ATP-binding domain-containing protein n=1 Tax=Peltaster fructicola TaxID=286661 RepID=A0A6H0XKF4_9PEZI|nr:hypothetical protein AMS68_000729 [Peltaster fructicola]